MKRRMSELEVSLEEGCIYIRQAELGEDLANTIQVYPEQVDLLIAWLKDAKQEAQDQR